MTDRELLEMIAAKVANMDMQLTEIREGFKKVNRELSEVKSRLTSIENIVTRIENEHGQKLQALFDGYKQHTDQIERIGQAVIEHEEILFKK
ncbi:hypothetical protein ODU73_002182 [Thermoclostridium stercorarium]|uniref:hypothetical protein n=1 Tax=Thermoclostridium stercorarium TaxID=1510 RepID=UPI002248B845|nr:hypothetical protein [Thermoclostridium stercorarium]UZQ85080.1 hypothetical protein ODU73_002182 [Thermoclostridium stercorarium]